ncbi:CbrC family protein [Ralstonia solanacearum]|uniref:CbrC family protein n=1 Tax=Ralstonia solanacearum TaxID=305 RepID=UPI001FFA6955|nr:CbrC family protein [Ralstonia solanacearum]MDB0511553.1 CbrC family protein [Ralstonia solanacearum]MDB0516183.1 CbrC family protein [Ralstonia solanacearum]
MNGTEQFPHFRYHPVPLATGAVVASEKVCACCNQARGCIYVGPVYSVNDLHHALCPWCIADGSAASTTLGASFSDSYLLVQAGMPTEVIEEVNFRTPGYISWQQESWLSHCGDACEFHGDAGIQDVESASDGTKQAWLLEYKQDEASWRRVTESYQPAGDSALYKFVCRHCKQVLFAWDLC